MRRLVLPLLLLVILSYFSISALLSSGYFNMHDDTQIARVYEMKNALQDGMLPVRWVENLGFGYGYPIFNFYSPLPYYLGGIINLAGLDSMTATKIMFEIGTVLSAVTMFFFLRKFFSPLVSVAGGLVYLYFPYHAVNIYIRGAVGEYFAYAFLPLVFLSLYSLYDNSKKNKKIVFLYIFLLAISVFLVTTSHNLSAFMMMLFVGIFTLMSVFSVKYKGNFLLSVGGGLLLGIGLSAFYFLPAIVESGYTNVASQVGGSADYTDHFVCISQYWNSMWGFGGTSQGCVDGFSFKLGKQNILLFVAAIVTMGYLYVKKRKLNNIMLINIILAIIAILLTLSVSQFVWSTLPYMSYIQYPWRFINFIAVFMVFSIGYLLFKIEKLFGEKVMIISVVGVIVVTLFLNGKLFVPQYKTEHLSSYYTNSRYIQFTTSSLTSEYMPKGFVKPKRAEELPAAIFSSPGASFTNVSEKTNEITTDFSLTLNEPVHINLAYYPAWHAYVNGEELELREDKKGMYVIIPESAGKLLIKYEQTPIAVLGNIITVGSFVGLIAGIIIVTKRKKHGK